MSDWHSNINELKAYEGVKPIKPVLFNLRSDFVHRRSRKGERIYDNVIIRHSMAMDARRCASADTRPPIVIEVYTSANQGIKFSNKVHWLIHFTV